MSFSRKIDALRQKRAQWRYDMEQSASYKLACLDTTYAAHKRARDHLWKLEARMWLIAKIFWYLSGAHYHAVRNIPWTDFPEEYSGPDGDTPTYFRFYKVREPLEP